LQQSDLKMCQSTIYLQSTAAEAASEELAKELLGVRDSNKRDSRQTCAVKFLHGTILHLSSKALELQPIEKSWKELVVSQAGEEGIRRIAAEAGELMLNSPGASYGSNIRHRVFAPMPRGARSVRMAALALPLHASR
jgi:hypothetical protein